MGIGDTVVKGVFDIFGSVAIYAIKTFVAVAFIIGQFAIWEHTNGLFTVFCYGAEILLFKLYIEYIRYRDMLYDPMETYNELNHVHRKKSTYELEYEERERRRREGR